MATTRKQWFVDEDGCLSVSENCTNITYHSSLNALLVATKGPSIKVIDVTSGSVLQKSDLCAQKCDELKCIYLPGKDKTLFCDNQSVGVRKDLRGILLLDTALQPSVTKPEDIVKIELPLAEASQLYKSLLSVDLPGTQIDEVISALKNGIETIQETTKGNHKTAKWATVCLKLPHNTLKTVCSHVILELKRTNVHCSGLAVASSVADRLTYLLPNSTGNNYEASGAMVDRALMYSEAARRETFRKWPHMNYKWALPDPMAQAGFYHQPSSSGDDRALCFTCNVCLVCWEPTDEPWSEHERHSPSCPFVKGEYTQNVPLSVTYATQPAATHSQNSEKIACVSTTSSDDFVATASESGSIIVWNVNRVIRKYCQFSIDTSETVVAMKTGIQIDSSSSDDTPVEDVDMVIEGAANSSSADENLYSEDQKTIESNAQDIVYEIPLHNPNRITESPKLRRRRPSDDVIISSLCIINSNSSENEDRTSSSNSVSSSSFCSLLRNMPTSEPTLLCGVSLRRSKFSFNCDEAHSLSDEKSDVQLMNQVNDAVSCDVPPRILPEMEDIANGNLLDATSYIPFILVVYLKEDSELSTKNVLTDLKNSMNTNGKLDSQSLNSAVLKFKDPADMIDAIPDSDSDADVQIVGVTPAPTSLPMTTTGSPVDMPHFTPNGFPQSPMSPPSISHPKFKHIPSPEIHIKKTQLSQNLAPGTVLQCIELPLDLQSESLRILLIVPTLDKQYLAVVVCPEDSDCSFENGMNGHLSNGYSTSSDSSQYGSVMLYRINYDAENISLDEVPCVTHEFDSMDSVITRITMLPNDLFDPSDDDDEMLSGHLAESGLSCKTYEPYGQMAVILRFGNVQIFNLNNLEVLVDIKSPMDDLFVSVTYCSGIERLCVCSKNGNLHFYQLFDHYPDVVENGLLDDSALTTKDNADDTVDAGRIDDTPETTYKKSSDILAKQPLSADSLASFHSLIQFENLLPRFTATVPPCWTEIQQEQQQRRHPQHLQQQGESAQHTRSWKLQTDSNTWDEHLFEIVLPKPCTVGHVDIKFSLYEMCVALPNIQITLLKQNISNIGKQANTSDSTNNDISVDVDQKIEFNIDKQIWEPLDFIDGKREEFNNVLDPTFLDSHNAEILCGPLNLSSCLDLSGSSGLVTLCSPQLLNTKSRSFLLHIKGFPTKEESPDAKDGKKRCAASSCTSDEQKGKTPVTKSIYETIPQSSLVNVVKRLTTNNAPKQKLSTIKGCDWIQEISITIRKTKKTLLTRERFQRSAMIELTSFHEKLIQAISKPSDDAFPNISSEHIQSLSLDVLSWITALQMNDPDKRKGDKCLLNTIIPELELLTNSCFIHGTRTIGHKCARFLSLCLEYAKYTSDQSLAPLFTYTLLHALLACLSSLSSAYSSGAVRWYFTLLNRVKCMDVSLVAEKCFDMLSSFSKQYNNKTSSLHAILKARYGLNGHPLDLDLFDMESPTIAAKQTVPQSTYASAVSTNSSSTSSSTSSSLPSYGVDEMDIYDLFHPTTDKTNKFQIDSCLNNSVLGLLEVEPLHFSCHATSDGTKMERIDSTNHTGPLSTAGSSGLLGMLSSHINFGDTSSLVASAPALGFNVPEGGLPPNLDKIVMVSKNQNPKVFKMDSIQEILNDVDLKLYQSHAGPGNNKKQPGSSSSTMPPTPKTTPLAVTPPMTPPNELWQQVIAPYLASQNTSKDAASNKQDHLKQQHAQSKPLLLSQSQTLLQTPPSQVLVVDRLHSGARRFVTLDFGKPILLTDVIIPACGDLASLSIDVWIQGEEVDGQRLIVAPDIGMKSLVMNNVMPPPICRYLKITTIGRYGSGPSKSRIPIGSFYGHSYILPWEWINTTTNMNGPCSSSVANQLEKPNQAQLAAQLGVFQTLQEDIQCRYSLAHSRLESLLRVVDNMQYSNAHTHYYLKKHKRNDEDNRIIQAYTDCSQLQLQYNLAQRAIDRLRRALGMPVTQVKELSQIRNLQQSSADKLRFLLENLLDTLLSMTCSTPSIPECPTSLYHSLNPTTCESIFRHLCISGNWRTQASSGLLLVRVCGNQPWWGEFLGNMLQEFFNSECNVVFPQDRVFVLLTALGQKATQGTCAVNIMESLLGMLSRVLQPLLPDYSHQTRGSVDLSLVGWMLLFLCRNLDLNLNGSDDQDKGAGARKEKDSGGVGANRWSFIQGCTTSSQTKVKSSKSDKWIRRSKLSAHKRLLHHKQRLLDLEQVKKKFAATVVDKKAPDLSKEAINLMKQQEQQFSKELSQYESKHLKDIMQMRRNEGELFRKLVRDDGASSSKDNGDSENDGLSVLPREKCLPVVRGLMGLLLNMDFTCYVDLFLVACKVLARICVATRPAITLTEAMTLQQLQQLIMLTSNSEFNHGNISWGGPWAGHAVTCLLQDILEGEKMYPMYAGFEGVTDDEISGTVSETDDSLANSMSLPTFDSSMDTTEPEPPPPVANTEASTADLDMTKPSSMVVDMLLEASIYNDITPSKLQDYMLDDLPVPPPKPPTPPTDKNYPVVAIDADEKKHLWKQHKDKLSEYLQMNGSSTLKSSIGFQGVSTALDSRLEYGLETLAELRLRIMGSVQTDSLQNAFVSAVPSVPSSFVSNMPSQHPVTDDELFEANNMNGHNLMSSSEMLSMCFDQLFSQLPLYRINLDNLLHLWLTLNEEPSQEDSSQLIFDSSRVPLIPLCDNSASSLLATVAFTPNLSVQSWVLIFQVLSLLSNQKTTERRERSMAHVIMDDPNLMTVLIKFLSGVSSYGPVASNLQCSQVGPITTKSFYEFLMRLQIRVGEENSQHLKELMLKNLYILCAERGAFYNGTGPLDAQCRLLDFILDMKYEQVEITNAISLIECISRLVHQHILCQERVTCRSSSETNINARSCFGGLFASLLKGTDSKSGFGDSSRDHLMYSLLKLVNVLIQVQLPAKRSCRTRVFSNVESTSDTPVYPSFTDPVSDFTKLSQALASSTPNSGTPIPDEEKVETDEQKSERSARLDVMPVYLTDVILSHQSVMFSFIQALSYCNSNTMAMILGSSAPPMQETFTGGDMLSVGDGIYQILLTLSKKCSNIKLLLEPLYHYLCGARGYSSNGSGVLSRLSEPLLWLMLKVLDNAKAIRVFLEMGGIEVVCKNLVHCNQHIISTSPSLISTIMNNLNNGKSSKTDRSMESESADGLQNFAPFGTISSSSPSATPADVLIQFSPPHRRARSAAWSYHFYPDEAWVDITIQLPFAILLREVQIQPHTTSLSTCPAYVSVEISGDGCSMVPACSPLMTSSLAFIKLQLQKPEVAVTVTVRLHKPRDSMTIGLSQILLMGYSVFGQSGYRANSLFAPTEDFVSRSSVGWIRLLHHCLTSHKDVEENVCNAAAPTRNLLNTCTMLLVSPILSVYSSNIEAVLLKLGLHSTEMGLSLINNVLRSQFAVADTNSFYLGKTNGVSNDSTVEIIYQLGTVQDSGTEARVNTMIQWLTDTAELAVRKHRQLSDGQYNSSQSCMSLPHPAATHVHCISALLWQSHELPVNYSLKSLLSANLVSCLYEWSCIVPSDSSLKRAVDFVLCSLCHIEPDYFKLILEWMGIMLNANSRLTASISDDSKDLSNFRGSMTDDHKEEAGNPVTSMNSVNSQITLQELNHMMLDESHLISLAYICKSPDSIKLLLNSGFPTVLAHGIFEFCNQEIGKFRDGFTHHSESVTDAGKSMAGACNSCDCRSDKSSVFTPDRVAAVLHFFAEIASDPTIKDWLGGSEGNVFFPYLLALLCYSHNQTGVQHSSAVPCPKLMSAEERSSLETATVRFFTQLISCHQANQLMFAKVMCDVIKEQGTSKTVHIGSTPLSGFTRRLFLQVLLEDEKVLVAFKPTPRQYRIQLLEPTYQIHHPCHGAGRSSRTVLVNLHISCGELLHKISDTPTLATQLLENKDSKKRSDDVKKDSTEIGLEMVDYLSTAAGIMAKEKRDKSPSSVKYNLALPPRPPSRRGRHTVETLANNLLMPTLCLCHPLMPDKALPSDLTLSQLVHLLQERGFQQGNTTLEFAMKVHSRGFHRGGGSISIISEQSCNQTDDWQEIEEEIPDELLLMSPSFPSALQVFASVGGLALLAEHLPILFPEISRQTQSSVVETPGDSGNDMGNDWVNIEPTDDYLDVYSGTVYDSVTPGSSGHSGRQHAGMPTIPPHSLIAFGLFLRLPGYAEVLLKERKKAQCLLRLVLGVTDDGDGGHILTSPIAGSLPTLPFHVLKSLCDSTPLTTDDGVLLRRMALDIGALHLILACLSFLSHHSPRESISGFQQETQVIIGAMQAANMPSGGVSTTEEKSQQYWAKGTGFGTGSTTSSWDAEQALQRQKSEEEHVTCLLQVLASYINPSSCIPKDFESQGYTPPSEKSLIPDVIPDLLSQSCLIPAISSYLRNDSVLDMARHVPLYRALLELLRGIAVCPSLGLLLLPLGKDNAGDIATSVGELLEKMRGCVDTYASRLKGNKGKVVGTKEEEEENEGLALLIPDIQETARIVHIAVGRLKLCEESGFSSDDSAYESSVRAAKCKSTMDEKYMAVMKELQFDTFEMVLDEGNGIKFTLPHHYESNVKAASDVNNPSRTRRLAQEAVTLSTSLPLAASSSVFVRCDEERLDVMKVLITGPHDTPYGNGCFEFDVYFPQDYPNSPPLINMETTGNHTVRFNPNLYNDGKVCLSVLNTWHGRPEEKWNPQTSSFLQVLVSIQSLILVSEPYFNEPGYERSRGTPPGTASSREYDANIRQATVKWGMLEQLRNPSPCFKELVQTHFWFKRHEVLRQCEEWIKEMEGYSADKRTGRTIAHSTLALKRHYNQLREELAKLKPPEDMEDDDLENIDLDGKLYETDQSLNTTAEQSITEAQPGPSSVVQQLQANSDMLIDQINMSFDTDGVDC